MNIQKISCVSCGAPVQIPSDVDQLSCTYCGTTLVVQRGEGHVALKTAEEVSQAIQDLGIQTQSTIREETQVTQAELRRLQLSQRLSAAQIQLSNLQAEIRALERHKRTRQVKSQLKDLRKQETTLSHQIRELELQGVLASDAKGTISTIRPEVASKPKSDSRVKQGCLTGCLVYIVVGVGLGMLAIPLDQLIFGISSESNQQGPFFTITSVVGFIAGIAIFLYMITPDAPIWKPIKKKLQRTQSDNSKE